MTQSLSSSSSGVSPDPDNAVAFQGVPGAYSHLACRHLYPHMESLPCDTFEDAFAAVREGRARLGMIPIENSIAGRVADIHHLLPESGLHIVGEYFLPVHHHLLALPEADISDITEVHSHVHALGQCRRLIHELGVRAIVCADTAGSARDLAVKREKHVGVLSSEMAAEIYGLKSLRANVEDARHNTTRFIIMAREPRIAEQGQGKVVTSFIFQVRNVPAALYKAMGGFATNGINMTKLESYTLGGNFMAVQFYAEVEAHPEDRGLRLALEELEFFSRRMFILGVYPAHPYRFEARARIPAE